VIESLCAPLNRCVPWDDVGTGSPQSIMRLQSIHMVLTCSAILFDLDGVLVHSIGAAERQWRKFAERHQLDPDYVLRTAHGQRTIETVHILVPHLDAQTEAGIVELSELEDTEGIRAADGAADLLGSLPRDRWAVVTSGTRALATLRLDVAKLPTPPQLVSADDVTRGKPNPEPYLKGARAVNADPASCIVFEDAPHGVVAAKAAGMRVIGIPGTFAASELQQADALVRGLSDVHGRMNGHGLAVELTQLHLSAAR